MDLPYKHYAKTDETATKTAAKRPKYGRIQ